MTDYIDQSFAVLAAMGFFVALTAFVALLGVLAVLLVARALALVEEIRIARAIQRRWAEVEPGYHPQPWYILVYRILKGNLW